MIDDGEFPSMDQIPDDEDFALFQAEEASEDENEDPNDMSNPKKEREEDTLAIKSWKQEWKEIAQLYYSTYSIAKSVAGVMYGISSLLNKASLELFWYWVLGITDQYVHSKITNDYYEMQLPEL